MNHMKEIANMLGVEFGEEFKVETNRATSRNNFILTEYGFFLVGDDEIPMGVTLNNLLTGKYKVIKLSKQPSPTLTKKEKEYLSYVIRPFKDEVKHICKSSSVYKGYEEITVVMECCKDLEFPAFEKNTMYKGMELEKAYTLEELGL